MGRRIVLAIVVVALVIGAYYIYLHNVGEKVNTGGEVTCNGCMTPDEKARFDKENSGDTADGQSERKTRTSRAEDAAGNPQGAVAAGQVAPPVAFAPVAAPAPATAGMQTSSAPYTQTPAPAATYNAAPSVAPAAMPVSDSQSANAPNGMRFAGNGNFQWYRQGNLTWRIDTVSGRSCIVYATMEEWRKQVVYSHGCGRDA